MADLLPEKKRLSTEHDGHLFSIMIFHETPVDHQQNLKCQ